MATFQYEAMNASGETVKDSVEAESSQFAINKIRALGYFPTKVRQTTFSPAEEKEIAKARKQGDKIRVWTAIAAVGILLGVACDFLWKPVLVVAGICVILYLAC